MEEKRIFDINPTSIPSENINEYMDKWIRSMNKSPMDFTDSKISQVEELVKSIPNDMELGSKIRNLFNTK